MPLQEMHKAGLVTKEASTYSCDTDAVAASHGLVNKYSPLPAKTPQNTPAVKEHTLPTQLQLSEEVISNISHFPFGECTQVTRLDLYIFDMHAKPFKAI